MTDPATSVGPEGTQLPRKMTHDELATGVVLALHRLVKQATLFWRKGQSF